MKVPIYRMTYRNPDGPSWASPEYAWSFEPLAPNPEQPGGWSGNGFTPWASIDVPEGSRLERDPDHYKDEAYIYSQAPSNLKLRIPTDDFLMCPIIAMECFGEEADFPVDGEGIIGDITKRGGQNPLIN